MGGPSAAILLRQPLQGNDEKLVRADLATLAEYVDGNHFRIEGRPFFAIFGTEYPGQLEETSGTGLSDVLGWKPQDVLLLVANCNDALDHRILGKLCLHFASRLRGVVGFGGRLAIGPSFDGTFARTPLRLENPSGVAGVLFT